jgi:hypothetical protein
MQVMPGVSYPRSRKFRLTRRVGPGLVTDFGHRNRGETGVIMAKIRHMPG